MRDLYRCLDEYPPALLGAIAEAWQLTLPKGDALETVRALGDGMTAPGALQRALSTLSTTALEALAELAQQGGEVPAQRFALRYGGLRRLGPARLAREHPWLQPSNAVEELYYRGLVYRTYGTLGDFYGDLLVIPEQLMQRLPALATPPDAWERPLETPLQQTRRSDYALMEDLFALLARLRQAPLPRAASSAENLPIAPLMERLAENGRLVGSNERERQALLWRLLERLGLVRREGPAIQPSLHARDWLRLSDESRMQGIYLAWRDDPDFDELCLLQGLFSEGKSPAGRPIEMRCHLLALLRHFPVGEWFPIGALAQAARRRHPDFLRVGRDAGWAIRDAQTGAYLDSSDSWEQVEGALIQMLLRGPFHWLDLVALGSDAEGMEATAFCVTPLGERLLALGERKESEKPAPHPVSATVDDDLVVRLPTANSLYERYQLERFAEWRGQDRQEARYQITEDSLWRSHDAGIRSEQILRFLRRITTDGVPQAAQETLQHWGKRFGRASLERMVVLQTVDAPTMAQIRADPQAAALLGLLLAPTACQVPEDQVEALVERLKAIGIWPRLRLGK